MLLKGLIHSFDELPELKRVDEATKMLSVPPGRKKLPSLANERRKSLNGRLFLNVVEALENYGFGETAKRCKTKRTMPKRFEVLRDFLTLLEGERGPVEGWLDPIIDPATSRPWPGTVEDLRRLWGI
jgi:hypothetical protein